MTTPTHSLIISHNYRIQCLLGKLGFKLGQNINFQHGCVLKITAEQKQLSLKMLYVGQNELNDNKLYYSSSFNEDNHKYEVRENSKRRSVNFYPYQLFDEKTPLPIQSTSYKNHVFYIIRYATYEQNLRNVVYEIKKDLLDYSIQHVFVSDLIRTRDTYDMLKIYLTPPVSKANDLERVRSARIKKLDKKEEVIPEVIPDAIVLPCSHEITTSGTNGNCDETTTILNTKAFDNYPNCTLDRIEKNKKNKTIHTECNADWDEYLNFYNKKMRNSMWTNKRRKCRDTNMLKQAIDIIDNIEASAASAAAAAAAAAEANREEEDIGDEYKPYNIENEIGGTRKRKIKRKKTRRIKLKL